MKGIHKEICFKILQGGGKRRGGQKTGRKLLVFVASAGVWGSLFFALILCVQKAPEF